MEYTFICGEIIHRTVAQGYLPRYDVRLFDDHTIIVEFQIYQRQDSATFVHPFRLHQQYELILVPRAVQVQLFPSDYYPPELGRKHWYGQVVALDWAGPASAFRGVDGTQGLLGRGTRKWHVIEVPPYGHLLMAPNVFWLTKVPPCLGHVVVWENLVLEVIAYAER